MCTIDFGMTQHGAVAGGGVHGTQQSHISCVLPHNTKKVEKSAEGNVSSVHVLDCILRQDTVSR